MSPRAARLGSVLTASALLTGFTSIAHAAQPGAHPQVKATYTIGVSVPFNQLKELAVGIQHGVNVAVAQANASHLVPGVTFKVTPLDDTLNGKYSGSKDAQNARQFINDTSVIGEVGPLNSGADKVSEPVYNRAGLVQISPSNTNPDLTAPSKRALYEPATAFSHSPITYFRTCTTDSYQGPEAALFAKKAGYKSVFVTDNFDQYGIGLAQAFKAEAQKIGLKVLGYAELDPNNIATSARSLATTIAAKKPQLVYFGGEYGPQGGGDILDTAIKHAGLNARFMGGDGIYASDFITSAAEVGAYATSVGGDPTKDPNATAFLKAEQKMYPGSSVQAYDTYSFDAANVILNGFAKAVKAHKIKVGDAMDQARRLIIARYVAQTKDYHGATGNFSFTANGDTTNHVIGVYQVQGTYPKAAWKFVTVAPAL